MDTSGLVDHTQYHSHVLVIENCFSCEGKLGLHSREVPKMSLNMLQVGINYILVNGAVSNVSTE